MVVWWDGAGGLGPERARKTPLGMPRESGASSNHQRSSSSLPAITGSPAFAGDDGCDKLKRKPLQLHHRLAIDLAGAGLGQFVDEFYLARIFVGQQSCLHKILQHSCRLACLSVAGVHSD